jgi:hypothetical protein
MGKEPVSYKTVLPAADEKLTQPNTPKPIRVKTGLMIVLMTVTGKQAQHLLPMTKEYRESYGQAAISGFAARLLTAKPISTSYT